MRGAVAAGHPLTADAAARMFELGGNAFDAVVAAAFASCATEPPLSSLGGGGLLMAHHAPARKTTLYDFFVDSPGLGIEEGFVKPEMPPVEVEFISTCQTFHVGLASVAVPGVLKGLVRIWQDLGTLDMEEIITPALQYLEQGVEVTEVLEYLLDILEPILTLEPYGCEIYAKSRRGRRLYNPLLLEFLRLRDPGLWLDRIYNHWPRDLEETLKERGALLTPEDMRGYRVFEREPRCVRYRGAEILCPPQPFFGGLILEEAFRVLSEAPEEERSSLSVRASIMNAMNRINQPSSGTTHISVLDEAGNAAALTVSNGSNSGCFFPGTGIMLNNMMGEDDLHPGGFFATPPGSRVGSMMSPSFIRRDGRIEAALGSGGSKRIRTAMFQVITNLLDRGLSAADSIEAPRMHPDEQGVLQLEPGFSPSQIAMLSEYYPINLWAQKDMYFGGVHMVLGDFTGWGDSRRGGFWKKSS